MTLTTRIHAFRFNISNDDEREAWLALQAKLDDGRDCFEALAMNQGNARLVDPVDGQLVELETKHLFANQWNTAPIEGVSETGLRVFDWALDIWPNKSFKSGHYLEITPEMKAIRENTLKCGYCGVQHPRETDLTFCDRCLGSEYLKAGDLKMLRLYPISNSPSRYPALSEAEAAELLPRYTEAQLKGDARRKAELAAQTRERVTREATAKIKRAEAERDGMLWLLDHDITTQNAIFYKHKSAFTFGWRTPLHFDVAVALSELLKRFPYDYEILVEGGDDIVQIRQN